jgi:hypothetical protein
MKKPVRTTVFFGLMSAVLVLPASWLLMGPLGWPTAIKLVLWADLALYGILLAMWSGKKAPSILFPLVLLFGAALWPGNHAGFFLMGLGILGWIRSGVCFTSSPIRGVLAEIVTLVGSAVLIALWGPDSTLTWAMAVWLFFLFQSLYFYMVPTAGARERRKHPVDSFESARQKLEGLLRGPASFG